MLRVIKPNSNDDVTYHPDWFNEMMKVHEQHPCAIHSPEDHALQRCGFHICLQIRKHIKKVLG